MTRRVPTQRAFSYRRDRDGTEDTYDIVHIPTNTVIAAFCFWDEEEQAKRGANDLVRGLNALVRNGGFIYHRGWCKVGDKIDGAKQWTTNAT